MTTSLITGGAGFVGINLADRLLQQGQRVVVLDDLSRAGVSDNLTWLRGSHSDRLRVEVGDVRDAALVRRALHGVDEVFHFAAQVAVTTSVSAPLNDFSVNVVGTLTLLEELRRLDAPPPLLFTSTNKVYGKCGDIAVAEKDSRYTPDDPEVERYGVGEHLPLQFASPYGCSKGAADQYVLDYADTYGMPTVVFRMSCIYGPHQCGNEDQGWVAHFLKSALAGKAVTLYGDGRQVRDILYVEDLLDAMQAAMENVEALSGQAFNMGGGPDNTVSLLELLALIGELGSPVEVHHGPWRVGDQRYYVSDTRRFSDATGWTPKTAPEQGVRLLHEWLGSSRLLRARAS